MNSLLINFGLFSYFLVVLFALLLILVIGYEVYRVKWKKVDRKFWSGLNVVFTMVFCAFMFTMSMDSLEKYQVETKFEGSELRVSGSLSYSALLQTLNYKDVDYCVIEDTVESKRCHFLMLFKAQEASHAGFISDEKHSIVRFGQWPFSYWFEFPSLNE